MSSSQISVITTESEHCFLVTCVYKNTPEERMPKFTSLYVSRVRNLVTMRHTMRQTMAYRVKYRRHNENVEYDQLVEFLREWKLDDFLPSWRTSKEPFLVEGGVEVRKKGILPPQACFELAGGILYILRHLTPDTLGGEVEEIEEEEFTIATPEPITLRRAEELPLPPLPPCPPPLSRNPRKRQKTWGERQYEEVQKILNKRDKNKNCFEMEMEREECEGCKRGYENQLGHSCLII